VADIAGVDDPDIEALTAGLSFLGSAVIALGVGDDGVEVLALWQVSPEGVASGAWVVRQAEAFGDEQVARKLLTCLDGRAVTGIEKQTVGRALARLSKTARLEVRDEWWSARSYSPVEVFAEVVARRTAYQKTIEARQQTTKNVAPLEWPRDFPPEELPANFEGLRELSTIAIAVGAPAVSEVLTVSRVLRWLAEMWVQTEQAKNRRPYLRHSHGDPEPLPPGWLAPMQTAISERLPR
jgi:hypothetical protein